jgi:hypothetical protein
LQLRRQQRRVRVEIAQKDKNLLLDTQGSLREQDSVCSEDSFLRKVTLELLQYLETIEHAATPERPVIPDRTQFFYFGDANEGDVLRTVPLLSQITRRISPYTCQDR